VQTGTTGAAAGTSSGKQLTAHFVKGMAIFVHSCKGGLMYEAAVGGQKFSFDPI
jgi:hypothetical protein